MQMMRLSGYRPDLSGCGICGREENLFFDMHEGHGILCRAQKGRKGALQGHSFGFAAYFRQRHEKSIFLFAPRGKAGRAVKNNGGEYVRLRLERSFNTLDFYETITS